MARVILSLKDGNTARRDSTGWIERAATIHVIDLEPADDDALYTAAYSAMYAAELGYGASHPSVEGLYLLGESSYRVMSRTRVDADVVFRRPTPATQPGFIKIRGGVVTVTEKTNIDADGNEIKLTWKSGPNAAGIDQPGTVDVGTPCLSLEYQKTFNTSPAVVAMDIVGKTNSDTWNGCAADYWLCTDFSFDSQDGGATWEAAIKFVANAKKWLQEVYYTLDSGKPPPNLMDEYNAAAHQLIRVYGSTAFGDLSLPSAI